MFACHHLPPRISRLRPPVPLQRMGISTEMSHVCLLHRPLPYISYSCCILPWCHLQRMGISTAVPPDRTLEYAGHYAAAARATAQALGLPLVDLYEQLQAVPGWRDW